MGADVRGATPGRADQALAGRRSVAFCPFPGSQTQFMQARAIPEVLYEGERGPGKTLSLIADFVQDVGRGYGSAWTGVLFRRTYDQLKDVISKSRELVPKIYPAAVYNKNEHYWTFPAGEILYLRYLRTVADYWNYHGHEYPWLGFEELTSWPTPDCYLMMFSCNRSPKAGIPKRIRSTTNPYGAGHNWVKSRFRLPHSRGRLIKDSYTKEGDLEPARLAIQGRLEENLHLMTNDPDYRQRVAAAARNSAERAAWMSGDWNIVAGGMFDDVWGDANVVDPFPVPKNWTIRRAFDWGSSKPFSVGWWATSDGSDVLTTDGWMSTVPGDKFRIGEWYGWTGEPNEGRRLLASEIARGIVEREVQMGLHGRVYPGPADSSIFDDENGSCVARDMKKPVRVDGRQYPGVKWYRADKSPGSRVNGWETMRKTISAARPERPGLPREEPGLFVFSTCEDGFLRTVPVLPRSDKNPDDVDTEVEDHVGDECRYFVTWKPPRVRSGQTRGI